MENEINVKKDKHYYVLNTKQSQEKVEFNFFKYTLFLSTPRRSLHHSNIYSARPFKRLRSCWCSSSCSARCSYLIILKNLFLLPILKFFNSFPCSDGVSVSFSVSAKNNERMKLFGRKSQLFNSPSTTQADPDDPLQPSLSVYSSAMGWDALG